jgi:hypothetical protein
MLGRVSGYGFVPYLPLTPVNSIVGNEPDLYVPDGHKNASDPEIYTQTRVVSFYRFYSCDSHGDRNLWN